MTSTKTVEVMDEKDPSITKTIKKEVYDPKKVKIASEDYFYR